MFCCFSWNMSPPYRWCYSVHLFFIFALVSDDLDLLGLGCASWKKIRGISGRICGASEDVAMSFCFFQPLARLVLGCETEAVLVLGCQMEGVAVICSLLFFSCACCTLGRPTRLRLAFSSFVPGVGWL